MPGDRSFPALRRAAPVVVAAAVAWLSATAASAAIEGRTVELILDASGSMNGHLASGASKIDAARTAVGQLVASLPPATVIALRVYGAGSPVSKHDCADTALVVPFGAAGTVKGDVVAAAAAIRAQGYTPITKVLEAAAAEFPAGAGERVIVLVSDGIETCAGDPCATARALAHAKVRTLIHTIGFGADETALAQLRCIATVTGGRSWGAGDAGQLAAALAEAVAAKGAPVAESAGDGTLGVRGADLKGNRIVDAETGKQIGALGHTRPSMKVPAGIYDVTIAASAWKGVEVRAGEETWLDPAVLEIRHASLRGHQVLDRETGEAVATVSAASPVVAVLPGTYDVRFGKAIWPDVVLAAGRHTVLDPGVVEVHGARLAGSVIRDAAGREVGAVSATSSVLPLPPGSYTIELPGGVRPFTLAEGQRLVLDSR